jgi:hypothetical protein
MGRPFEVVQSPRAVDTPESSSDEEGEGEEGWVPRASLDEDWEDPSGGVLTQVRWGGNMCTYCTLLFFYFLASPSRALK